jgi:hypothetical protein
MITLPSPSRESSWLACHSRSLTYCTTGGRNLTRTGGLGGLLGLIGQQRDAALFDRQLELVEERGFRCVTPRAEVCQMDGARHAVEVLERLRAEPGADLGEGAVGGLREIGGSERVEKPPREVERHGLLPVE